MTNATVSGLVATLTLLHPLRLDAQAAARAASNPMRSCLDTVSLKPSKQLLVYVRDSVDAAAPHEFAAMADLFTQSVSQHLRQLLHGKGQVLPRGEPTVTWRNLETRVAVIATVHREGPATFAISSPPDNSASSTLLLGAATDAVNAGEGTYWPDSTPGDSAQFGIGFVLPPLGNAYPLQSDRVAFPTFSLMFPSFTPVAITSTTSPEYPAIARQLHATGTVIIDFEVDSTGQVLPQSIQDVWPPGQARLTGVALGAYNALVASVAAWLQTAQFEPGRIGGCPVRQMMRQTITFDLPAGGE